MNVRRIKDLVTEIRTFTNSLPNKDDKSMDDMVRFESGVALDNLNYHLDAYSRNEKVATVESLLPLLKSFAARSDLLGNTDSNYFCNPTSLGNVSHIYAAKVMGRALKIDYLKILMPNVQGLDSTRNLHEYILRDHVEKTTEGKEIRHAMLVEDGFNMLEKKFNSQGDATDPACDLTMDEEQLLASHSELATTYYYAMKDKTEDAPKLKEELFKALRDPNYKTTASYLESNKSIIDSIIKQQVTKHQFLLLLKRLPIKKWSTFMGKISDGSLYDFLLNIKNYDEALDAFKKRGKLTDFTQSIREKFYTALQSPSRLKLDCWEDKYVRALHFAYSELYKRFRTLEPNYTSLTAEKVSSYFPTFGRVGTFFTNYIADPVASKEEKEKACMDYQDTICDKAVPLAKFETSKLYLGNRAFKGGLFKMLVQYMFETCKDANKLAEDIVKVELKKAGVSRHGPRL